MSCLALASMGMQLAGGAMSYRGLKQAGQQAEQLSQAQAYELTLKANQLKKQLPEDLQIMGEQKEADIGTSVVSAAKGGVRAGTGSPLKATEKISTQWDRNMRIYGQNAADEIRSLETQAFWTRKQGKWIKKAKDKEALGSLLGSGAKVGLQASEFDWGKLFA